MQGTTAPSSIQKKKGKWRKGQAFSKSTSRSCVRVVFQLGYFETNVMPGSLVVKGAPLILASRPKMWPENHTPFVLYPSIVRVLDFSPATA